MTSRRGTRAVRRGRCAPGGGALAASLLASLLAAPATAAGQGTLASYGTVSVGPLYETLEFGDGVLQPGLTSGTDVVVRRASQLTIPFAVTYPVTRDWTLDIAGARAEGEVELGSADPALGGARRYRLSGTTDVRMRATGRVVGDNLLVTLGVSWPTGAFSLDREELSALRVLGAPALGFQMPAVSVGRSGTAGLVLTRQVAGWAWALGGSYEVRGRYNPVQAFAAGIPDPDFDPGDAAHLSLGAEGMIGPHVMTISTSADLFTGDELRAAGTESAIAAVELGPIYTAEWQLRFGTRRFRELTLYAIDRYRTRYEQDGVRIPGSDANYLDVGLRAVRRIGARVDLLAALNARHQTGLEVDSTVATAATAAGGLTLGLSRAIGTVIVQPWVRGQFGRLDAAGARVSVSGFAGGLALGGRF